MGMSDRDEKVELKKGPWTREEDQKLLAYIQEHGHGSWRALPTKAGLERCGKSCRLRWTNYLRPDIKRGKFSSHEEKTIIRLHALLGNRWSAIAAYLPKRTDNEIKNYWNTRLKKRLTRMGIDPSTHRPKSNPAVTHTAQWEAARLEAEARLVRGSHSLRLFQTKLTSRPRLQSPQLAVLPCLDVLKVWQANNAAGASNINLLGSETSPTSTLNFCTKNSSLVPESGGSLVGNSSASVDDRTESSWGMMRQHVDDYGCPVDNSDCYPTDSIDFTEGYCINSSENSGALEDTRNYWSELLNLVGSSPLETPWTF